MTEAVFTLYLIMGAYLLGLVDAKDWPGVSPLRRELCRASIFIAWPMVTIYMMIENKWWLK